MTFYAAERAVDFGAALGEAAARGRVKDAGGDISDLGLTADAHVRN
jgi:hypothetical protein